MFLKIYEIIIIIIITTTVCVGCGPHTKITCFKDVSYSFVKSKKNMLISIVNYDDWQTKGNQVLVSNILNAVKSELLKAGYNIYTLDNKCKNKEQFKTCLKKYLIKNTIDYHLIITLEPTQQEKKIVPPSTYVSYEFMIANVYDEDGRIRSYYWQVPMIRVRGRQIYTYHITSMDLALYDVNKKKQVWLGKAKTKGKDDNIQKFYIKPAIKLTKQLIDELR